MSSEAVDRVRELAAKLAGLSERLRDPEVGDSEAAELAREAAELVSQAGNEVERALADQDPAGS
jgi:phosphate uptake regulator